MMDVKPTFIQEVNHALAQYRKADRDLENGVITGFGLAKIKKEDTPADPRDYDWACNLDECPICKSRFDTALKRYNDYNNSNKS